MAHMANTWLWIEKDPLSVQQHFNCYQKECTQVQVNESENGVVLHMMLL